MLHAPGVGSKTFADLLHKAGDPESLFSATPAQLSEWRIKDRLRSYLRTPDKQAVERDLAWRDAEDKFILPLNDPRYPPLLREIPDPPPLLFVHGDPDTLSLPQLAMVGSRNPTPQGKQLAKDFARFFSSSGLTITSGLAMGIDCACHEGALAGGGRTIAVSGTGLDRVYPAVNRELAHRIVEQGAMVSEFPVGTPPRAGHFPKRNRIISGLSVGTLVVEATLKSGSLITARLALEQGREVFAIPGSIHSPQVRGCHLLIRQGAKLVEKADDVIEELGAMLAGLHPPGEGTPKQQQSASGLDQEYLLLLQEMGYDNESIDVLIERTGLTANVISSMLLVLELEGYVSAAPGGGYCRTGKEPAEPKKWT